MQWYSYLDGLRVEVEGLMSDVYLDELFRTATMMCLDHDDGGPQEQRQARNGPSEETHYLERHLTVLLCVINFNFVQVVKLVLPIAPPVCPKIPFSRREGMTSFLW
jgi:hypothetical protein